MAQRAHWVFGYGSLIWKPGFEFVRAERALLRGAHRRLCIYSEHYRGTPEQPGLVFGLARGGSCGGMAFEVDEAIWSQVHAYLSARELLGNVYHEVMRPVRLGNGAIVEALTYLAVDTHELYAGHLALAAQAEIVGAAQGVMGANLDYVLNTAEHLAAMGIIDRQLEALVALLLGREQVAA